MSSAPPTLWQAILARLDPPPTSDSIDSVHAALGGVVGRGTVQRIKDGTAATSTLALSKIAKQLGCTASDLLAATEREFLPAPTARGIALHMSQTENYADPPITPWSDLVGADLTKPFRLAVRDGAFGEQYPPGCIMRLDPSRKPRGGWPVLVRDKEGEHYLRDYQEGPAGRWQAIARVRGFAPLDSVDDGLQLVAVMSGVDWP